MSDYSSVLVVKLQPAGWQRITCLCPGCDEPPSPGRRLCAEHVRLADESARHIWEEDARRGFCPPERMVGGDV